MEQTRRREERPVRSGRLRAALKSTAQVARRRRRVHVVDRRLRCPACSLLPGVGDLANPSVAISLQSALLGIDDTSGRPSSVSVRASLRALGLTPTQQLLSHDLLRLRAHPRADRSSRSSTLARLLQPRPGAPAHRRPSSRAARRRIGTRGPSTCRCRRRPAARPLRRTRRKPAVRPSAPTRRSAPVARSACAVRRLAQSQTIVFTSTPPANAVVGVVTYLVSATASSGLPVAFSADPSSSGVCTVSGTSGRCSSAREPARSMPTSPATRSYHAAARVQQSFAVGSGATYAPACSRSTSARCRPAGAVVGGSDYVVVATASSGLPVDVSGDRPTAPASAT